VVRNFDVVYIALISPACVETVSPKNASNGGKTTRSCVLGRFPKSFFSSLATDLLTLPLLASPLAHLGIGPTRFDLEHYTGLVTAGFLRSTEEGDGRFSEPDDLGGRYPGESRGESSCPVVFFHLLFLAISNPFLN
jgi:hypothetical protein